MLNKFALFCLSNCYNFNCPSFNVSKKIDISFSDQCKGEIIDIILKRVVSHLHSEAEFKVSVVTLAPK